jgi:beta-lactamase regulating signal transducer with metallopeptidase domain
MSSVLELPAAQALAWALVHFVWQGAAIALVAVAVQRFGRLSASARYTTGVLAMAAMLAAPAITFVRLAAGPAANVAATAPDTALPAVAAPSTQHLAPSTQSGAPGTQHPPSPAGFGAAGPASGTQSASVAPAVILVLWSAGVIVLSLRLLGGWFVARRLARRRTSPATPEIQALARKIAGRLALDRIVGVFESSAVSVPVMIGWMRPVVLLPAAALAGLSVPQVEALIAHELAHVRRHDYLVNLLQSAVETLLFYHPAVWWVSGRMRVDRELCCDDVALEVCDRIVYATALSDLAAMTTPPRMALAATDGPLLNRVRRILGGSVDGQESGSGWLSICLVVLLVGSLAPSALTSSNEPQSAGVQSGVVGGVQPGVAGGVQSGVVGGVQPGVVGGVQSGVPGVVGGVQGAIPPERPVEVAPEAVRTQTTAQAEETRKIEQDAAARGKALEEERRKIELARVDNEYRHTSVQSQARLAALESDLKLLRQQYERAQKSVSAGVTDSTVLAELESKIARTQQAMASEKAEFEYQAQDFDLKRRALALERELRVQDEERSARLVEMDKVQEKQTLEARQKFEIGVAAREGRGFLVEGQKALGEYAASLGPSEVARAGDIVSIMIRNEPDLPTKYMVQTDGTIRFPLVGTIRVLGLTARQVQEAVGKLLTDRKLAAGSGVEVTLSRPKTPEAGR